MELLSAHFILRMMSSSACFFLFLFVFLPSWTYLCLSSTCGERYYCVSLKELSNATTDYWYEIDFNDNKYTYANTNTNFQWSLESNITDRGFFSCLPLSNIQYSCHNIYQSTINVANICLFNIQSMIGSSKMVFCSNINTFHSHLIINRLLNH